MTIGLSLFVDHQGSPCKLCKSHSALAGSLYWYMIRDRALPGTSAEEGLPLPDRYIARSALHGR